MLNTKLISICQKRTSIILNLLNLYTTNKVDPSLLVFWFIGSLMIWYCCRTYHACTITKIYRLCKYVYFFRKWQLNAFKKYQWTKMLLCSALTRFLAYSMSIACSLVRLLIFSPSDCKHTHNNPGLKKSLDITIKSVWFRKYQNQ